MEIYEVTVVKKGCNGLVKIAVVVHHQKLSKEEQETIAREMLQDEVVFVSPTEEAHCKFTYFINGEEILFSFIGLAAKVHVMKKFYPELCAEKIYELEMIETTFTLELRSTSLIEKDLELIQSIEQSIALEKKPYWHFNDSNINGYDIDQVLLEVPTMSPFITKSATATRYLQSSLISLEEINEAGKYLLGCKEQMKFRMQIKFDEQSMETILLTLYIQDIENGHMTRMDVMTSDVREITA